MKPLRGLDLRAVAGTKPLRGLFQILPPLPFDRLPLLAKDLGKLTVSALNHHKKEASA